MISKKGFGKYSQNNHDYLKNVMILMQSGNIDEAEKKYGKFTDVWRTINTTNALKLAGSDGLFQWLTLIQITLSTAICGGMLRYSVSYLLAQPIFYCNDGTECNQKMKDGRFKKKSKKNFKFGFFFRKKIQKFGFFFTNNFEFYRKKNPIILKR